jgi:hypothetical protein
MSSFVLKHRRHVFLTTVMLAGITLLSVGTGYSQLSFSGDGAVAAVKSTPYLSQYTYDDGNMTFAYRWDLFADAQLSDNVLFFSNLRVEQDQTLHVDRFSILFRNVADQYLNVEAGEIDIPFGNLGNNRFPKENPFFQLPLMNEHISALCSSDYRVWTLEPVVAYNGDGVHILDEGLYDLGVKAYGYLGPLEYDFALINGMISETGSYSATGLNQHDFPGRVVRLALQPLDGLSIGASYAYGAFLSDQSEDTNSVLFGKNPDSYPAEIWGADADYSIDHLTLSGEIISNTWKGIETPDLKTFGYTAQAQYAFTPRVSGAVRLGGLVFNSITAWLPTFGPPQLFTGDWDENRFRSEFAVGVRLTREALLKFVYERDVTAGVSEIDNVGVMQVVYSY